MAIAAVMRTSSSNAEKVVLASDTFAWQKVNRIVNREILPNIDEVVIVRQQSQE